MSLKWRGDEVRKKVERAVRLGIDETMGAAVIQAKQNHEFINRTGTLERSVVIVAPARNEGDRIVGLWGSAQVQYAAFIEFGTSRMRELPFLRPAARATYPGLTGAIRANFA